MIKWPTYRDRVKPWKRGEAKKFRKNPTETEAILWSHLRKQNLGVRFQRQAIILGYIADFWCPAKKMVVEVDGPYHNDTKDYDGRRDKALAGIGIKTLRIKSVRVMEDIQSVLGEIKNALGWIENSQLECFAHNSKENS